MKCVLYTVEFLMNPMRVNSTISLGSIVAFSSVFVNTEFNQLVQQEGIHLNRYE